MKTINIAPSWQVIGRLAIDLMQSRGNEHITCALIEELVIGATKGAAILELINKFKEELEEKGNDYYTSADIIELFNITYKAIASIINEEQTCQCPNATSSSQNAEA